METTFISIHDLSRDAKLLYVSDSVWDILGYNPQEVINETAYEYFHPDEIPFARSIHGRGVTLDKAAVLNYCQIKHKDGYYVGCECCFTVVYDVLVACTSIYRHGAKSQKRAIDAPVIRQRFSSSPKDPRYHMLSYISTKFSQENTTPNHEPRAALFLNRYTRTLTVMYASDGLADIVGLTPAELKGKSFYFCIAEECLQEAVRCLESAKANDSIAYLRFWFRDPRQDNQGDSDDEMQDSSSDDGGVHLTTNTADATGFTNVRDAALHAQSISSDLHSAGNNSMSSNRLSAAQSTVSTSHSSSSQSNDLYSDSLGASGQSQAAQSSQSSVDSPNAPRQRHPPVEVEAVVSCSSDGLVVVLRRARTPIPQAEQTAGIFASPWGADPIVPAMAQYQHPEAFGQAVHAGAAAAQAAQPVAASGPPTIDFMKSIREVAAFAWALTGINGALAQYGRGKPKGESAPPGGQPIWDPTADGGNRYNGYADNSNRRIVSDEEYENGNPDSVFSVRRPVPPTWSHVQRPTQNERHYNRLDEDALRRLGWHS
ncbi:MAG: hypothetical protein M1834_001174 [Cirrosporium novae-zelandiae]|nr:MAG: hypothetical protein M1834_001174 [Cirrosporium novae-zelandiae]